MLTSTDMPNTFPPWHLQLSHDIMTENYTIVLLYSWYLSQCRQQMAFYPYLPYVGLSLSPVSTSLWRSSSWPRIPVWLLFQRVKYSTHVFWLNSLILFSFAHILFCCIPTRNSPFCIPVLAKLLKQIKNSILHAETY